MIFVAQIDNSMCPASAEFKDVTVLRFFIHDTGALFVVINFQIVDLLVSLRLDQSAPEYAVSKEEITDDLGKNMFRSIVPITNLSTLFAKTNSGGHGACRCLSGIFAANEMSSLVLMARRDNPLITLILDELNNGLQIDNF